MSWRNISVALCVILFLSGCQLSFEETRSTFSPPISLYAVEPNLPGSIFILKSNNPDATVEEACLDVVVLDRTVYSREGSHEPVRAFLSKMNAYNDKGVRAVSYVNNGRKVEICFENGERLSWEHMKGRAPITKKTRHK